MGTNKLKKTRFIKAYLVTLRIVSRYFILFLTTKLMSDERASRVYQRAHEKTARQITKTLQNLKGIYIKIGQTLSVMGNVLPDSLTQGLEALQDGVPPHAFAEINTRFVRDLGKEAKLLFQSIDPIPIASASLGQVHVATHKNGEKLAVKVQYPDIEDITVNDLKTLKNIFSLLNFLFPHYNLRFIYDECAKIILEELDYKIEAQNIERIESNSKDNDKIVFPKVYHELSSSKILTLSFIEGHKVTHSEKIKKAKQDLRGIAKDLIHFYCKQIFIDGIYHADPHPGNIVITRDGKIAMLDFGAVAQVSAKMREGLTLFVEGLIKKEAKTLSQALRLMGFVAKKDDEETLDTVVEYFYTKIRGIKIDSFKNLNLSQFHNLNDLIELKKLDISFKDLSTLFVVPRDWILLERAIILVTGLTSKLDETLNPVDIVVPYVEEFLLGKDSKKLAEILLSASKDMILSTVSLPDDLRKFIKKLKNEGLRMHSRSLKNELRQIRHAVHALAFAILAAASGFIYAKTPHDFKWAFYIACLLLLYSLIRR